MASRGSLNTDTKSGTTLKIYFDLEVTDIDPVAGIGILKYKLYRKSSNTIKYSVFGIRNANNRNYYDKDNTSIFQADDEGAGTKANPYKMYTKEDQHNLSNILCNNG